MAFVEKEAKSLSGYKTDRRFTASARAAMIHILAAKKAMDGRGILLPAYIGQSQVEGSGVFDPIRSTGIAYEFYRVDEQLRPDLCELKAKLETGRFQLVFLIHYFGCPQVDVEAFVRLCHSHGALVVEDCAHSLLGGFGDKRLGTYGDFAIFSIHKSIATADGGFFLDHHGELSNVTLQPAFEISPITLAEFANTDLATASRQRLHNYERVAGWVQRLSGLQLLFKRVPYGVVPLNCPVLVAEGRREQLYFELVERGVMPTALYHTLISEIHREGFPQSHFVADNILNLPTHPDISDADHARYEVILTASVKKVFPA